MSKLAKGLSLIADAFDATESYNETSVEIDDVKEALISYDSFFSNADVKVLTFYMSTLINMLDNGKPVYTRGETYDSTNNDYYGHAWVVDGYLHIKETFSGSNNYTTFYCLHHNWGWYGLHDGYYTLDSYLATDRFDYESGFDRAYIDPDDDDDYTYSRRFIAY